MDDKWLVGLGIASVLAILLVVFVVEILAVFIIVSWMATVMGLTGWSWWIVAIFLFIVINGVLGLIFRGD